MNYFEKPYIPPLKEELCVEKHIFLEENIEVYEEVHEDLTIEEESKIKIVEEINEDPIMEKDLKFEIVETIKEENIEEVVNDLDEVKLDDCNIQASIILVGGTETKFIDFIGVERFDLIMDSFGEYCQLHENQGRSSNCPIKDFQVWQVEGSNVE